MDPITAIVAAVVAAASQTAGTVVSEELKKAYGALKSKILSLFGRDPVVGITLDAVEANHESPQAAAALTQTLAGHDLTDPELRELADRVLEVAGPTRIENALRLAEDAVAENNRVNVTAPGDFAGSITNEVEVGKGATAKGNVVGVNLTGAPDDEPSER